MFWGAQQNREKTASLQINPNPLRPIEPKYDIYQAETYSRNPCQWMNRTVLLTFDNLFAMKVISLRKLLAITPPENFLDLTADQPVPGPRDLLVEVRAISVNPVDAKIRAGGGPGKPQGELPILGWDAAGVVREVGTGVTLFKPGDEVYYAGELDRPGSYAEFQCVDERIVGTKPKSVGFAAADRKQLLLALCSESRTG